MKLAVIMLTLSLATPAFAGRIAHPSPTRTPMQATATATPTMAGTPTPTPTATPTPIIPSVCTHQAGVEFASTFTDGTSDGLVANCPGFAATRLGLPPFTTLNPSTTPTQLAFDDVVSQGYNSEVDWSGIIKLTNRTTDQLANLTVTAFIGPTSGPCDWTNPFACAGLYSETTQWLIGPSQTAAIPFHEFVPVAYPQPIYLFLFATTDTPLIGCGVQYQSSECGGTQ